jgi:hypothetical protein
MLTHSSSLSGATLSVEELLLEAPPGIPVSLTHDLVEHLRLVETGHPLGKVGGVAPTSNHTIESLQ